MGWLWYLGMLLPVDWPRAVWKRGGGRPVYLLAANRLVHCPGVGGGGLVRFLAVSPLGVRRRFGIGAGGFDGVRVATDVVLADSETLWNRTLACTSDNYGSHDAWNTLAMRRPDRTMPKRSFARLAIRIKKVDYSRTYFKQ